MQPLPGPRLAGNAVRRNNRALPLQAATLRQRDLFAIASETFAALPCLAFFDLKHRDTTMTLRTPCRAAAVRFALTLAALTAALAGCDRRPAEPKVDTTTPSTAPMSSTSPSAKMSSPMSPASAVSQ